MDKEAGKRLMHFNSQTQHFQSYDDGTGVWTVGYGHIKDVFKGMSITKNQAELFFKEDVERHIQGIYNYIKVPITQNQFDALTSLAFNLGPDFLKGKKLLANINAGRDVQAAKEFHDANKMYNKKSGKLEPSDGLTIRRYEESLLFLKGLDCEDDECKQFVSETQKMLKQLQFKVDNRIKKQ
ncbi:MAG: putative lysozyme [Streblomastix strix]|uniref:Putative lysozyme n=1 Tax=Streblomastix strix TaxID=222440 RepID=A0A5J4VHC4_9EUKA|nr:MAG: putative lysozyme [Streblomastix strix]